MARRNTVSRSKGATIKKEFTQPISQEEFTVILDSLIMNNNKLMSKLATTVFFFFLQNLVFYKTKHMHKKRN